MWLRAVLVLCTLGWIAWLAGLAVETSNPVALNRAQILAADVIVEGRWLDAAHGRIAVERVWKRSSAPKEIVVRELPDLGIPKNGAVLLPLTQIGKNEFRVTSGEVRNPAEFGGAELRRVAHVQPLGYPATADAIRELEQLLQQ